MNILILGAGLTGCAVARLLKDKGHSVVIHEKLSEPGGLSITKKSPKGIKYEPYGNRIFHTKHSDVEEFIKRFSEFNGYHHKKGIILNDKLYPFPLTKQAIQEIDPDIFNQINNKEVDKTNFETACLAIFGEKLYKLFVKNYTERMWGLPATELSSSWVSERLYLYEEEDILFKNQWQGIPVDGYSVLVENMLKGIDIKYNNTNIDVSNFDLTICTGPLDEHLEYKFGKLEYRSIIFTYSEDDNEKWEHNEYGTINLPQNEDTIRKCNFAVIHKQLDKGNFIQYHTPTKADKNNKAMYPLTTQDNEDKFDLYLKDICKTKVMPLGRLGLFKYINMDTAIKMSIESIPVIESYLNMNAEDRYKKLKEVRHVK